jgi:hypothetical protein
VRPRHTDSDLLELAREGSGPAFASLVHRHRDVIARGVLRTEHPEQVAEATLLGAIRRLRRDEAPTSDVRTWLTGLVEDEVRRDPGRPGVDRILPNDWFDRAWVKVERAWPTGRRRPRPPRWMQHAFGALLLAAGGALATFMVVTSEVVTEVISELVAEPIDDPDLLVTPGPVVDAPPEEIPELFGDVELGELPTYDLTGGNAQRPAPGPTIAPPAAGTSDDDPGGSADGDPDTDRGAEADASRSD